MMQIRGRYSGVTIKDMDPLQTFPFLMGKVAANINQILPAKVIVDTMVGDAIGTLNQCAMLIKPSL